VTTKHIFNEKYIPKEHFSREKRRRLIQVHCHFKSEFFLTGRSNASSLNSQHPVACLRLLYRLPTTYILPYIFFHNVFQKDVPTQYVNNPVRFSSFTARRISLSLLIVCDNSPFVARSIQIIFDMVSKIQQFAESIRFHNHA